MSRIAVTGASGFIGTVVTRRLLARGYRVSALTRSSAARRGLQCDGAEVVSGSLADPGALRRLVETADAVVHCAGAVRGRSYGAFANVNVQGAQNLLAALGDTAMPLVALSSLAAREPSLSHYARSKKAMEAVLNTADAPAERLILRPPAVYGPGDRELLPLFRAFERGFAPLPAPPEARVSLIFVEDLADAMIAWLTQANRRSGVFEIHDGQPRGYSWDEIIGIAQTLLHRRIRRIRIPGPALDSLAWGNAGLSRVLRYAPMLTPEKLQELRHPDWVCDNAPLQHVLDWQPRIDLARGLERTCGWRPAA